MEMNAQVELKIKNAEGLHARPAGLLAKRASEFQSVIQIEANGQRKNAKSIMALMGMGLKADQEIRVIAEGADAEAACQALADLINAEFKS